MKKLVIYILLCNSIFGFSQEDSNANFPQFVEVQTGYGFIAKHSAIMDYYITGHIPNININIGKRLTGNKNWHKLYAFPEVGLGYYYAYLNNKYVGSSHAIYSFIKLPFSNNEKRFKTTFDVSFGLSYITKPFDMETNYQNMIIGSHFNVYFKAGFDFAYQLNDKFTINSIIGLNHYSNGKIKSPNSGINAVNLNLGLKYSFAKPKIINKEFTNTNFKKDELLIVYGAGIKATSKPLSKRYFASALVFDYYRRVSQKSKFGAGVDLFYDGTLEYYYHRDSVDYAPILDNFLFGTHLSYGLIFNKVSFNFQLGYYIYDELSINGDIYSRVGFRAYLTDKIILNLTLKTHFAKADLLEIGVGYRIL